MGVPRLASVPCFLQHDTDRLLSTDYVPQPNKVGTIIIPILPIRKLGVQELKQLVHGPP